VNLRGLEQAEIHRGEVVTHPGEFKPSYIVDVKLRALVRSPVTLRNRKKVRLHHYTSDVEAVVVLPDMDALEPGQEVVAQLRTASPIVPATGDRFVVRALSPSITLGGGVILNPRGQKLKARSSKAFVETDRSDDSGIVASLVRSTGVTGVTRNELLGLSGLSSKRLDKVLDTLRNSHTLIRFDPGDNRMIHADFFTMVKRRILDRLSAFHVEQPLKQGMSKQELRSIVPGSDKLFRAAMEALIGKDEVADQGDTVRLPSHKVQLKDEEKGVKDRILRLIVEGGNQPPGVKEMIAAMGADPKQVHNLLSILEKEGKVVRVKEDIYFSAGFVNQVKGKVAEFIQREGGLTPSQFHDITGSSRKYNIPLLEYFDRQRFTLRVGDQRVLRGSGTSGDGGKLE
jgi:selenocysteine-specific elongation factor